VVLGRARGTQRLRPHRLGGFGGCLSGLAPIFLAIALVLGWQLQHHSSATDAAA